MSGDNDNVEARPAETRPRKYYWPWECTYYWPWQIRWQGGNPLKGFRFSLLALMLLVTAAAFGSCCIGLAVRETHGTNLTAAEANKRLWLVRSYCEVPEGATDVYLRASYMRTAMSFEMPFSEFAAYCSDRGCYLRQIDPNWPQYTHDVDHKPLMITNGYYYRKVAANGGGYHVYYDMSTRRAWIHWSSH
jgi:hypothetical protein